MLSYYKCDRLSRAIIFNLQQPARPMGNDTSGIQLINADSSVVFEQVFKANFKNLHSYAMSIVKDESTGEEMVQNVFLKLWEKKEQIDIKQSIAAYLYKAVYYECLNYLKHTKVKAAYNAHAMRTGSEEGNPSDNAALKELQQQIDHALNDLPEQCRTIFQMSRYEELKYRMIADQLGISIKTVEGQMGKALRILRQKLADYLPILLILFVNLKKIFL